MAPYEFRHRTWEWRCAIDPFTHDRIKKTQIFRQLERVQQKKCVETTMQYQDVYGFF